MIADCVSMEYEAADMSAALKDDSRSPNIILLTFKVLLLSFIEFIKGVVSFFNPPKPASLNGQLALVTGGGNGLGKALSRRLAKEKCDIAIVDLDIKNARKTASEIEEEFQVQCKAYQCDVSDASQILKLKSEIESEMRAVNILVNNAGVLYVTNFTKSELKDIQQVISVNLTAQIMLTRLFLPDMISRNYGRIVSICSIGAMNSLPFGATYTASKYGCDGFMNALYDELCVLDADDKIILTTIYPDVMRTRKEFVNVVEHFGMSYAMLTPERAADEAVDAIKMGKRTQIVSDFTAGHVFTNKLPDRVRMFVKEATANIKVKGRLI